MSNTSAFMTSTMLSESGRMIDTPGMLRADRSRLASVPFATTSTRPVAASASR